MAPNEHEEWQSDVECNNREEEMEDGEERADEIDEVDDGEERSNGFDPNSEEVQRIRSQLAECGVIETIHLRNFLCHEDFTINLSPHLNFINGQNGSGKSAILIGIMACFGVRASETNRGKSVKDWIKHEQDWGFVEVTLSNRGTDAFGFKPNEENEFGPRITIRREFRRASSSSTYRVFNANRVPMKGRRELVVSILEHFCIQVDNPCVVLSQDATKEFLKSQKGEDKYKFFLRATQLQKIGEDLAQAEKLITETRDNLLERKEQVHDLLQDVEHSKQRLDDAQSLENIDEKLKGFLNEKLWAFVVQEEKELEGTRATFAKFQEQKRSLDEQYADADEKKEDLIQEQNEMAETLKLAEQRINAEQQKKQSLKEETKQCRGRLWKLNYSKKELKMRLSKCEERLVEYRKSYDEVIRASNKDIAQEKDNILAKIEVVSLDLQLLHEKLSDAEKEQKESSDEHSKLKASYSVVAAKTKEVSGRLQTAQNQLSRAQRSRQNRLARFGEKMPEFVKEIQRNLNRFSQPPIGPLGSFVTMKQSDWTLACESAIGERSLTSFWVANFDDQKLLFDIFKRVNGRSRRLIPQIIVSKPSAQKYDWRKDQHLVDKQLLSVLDVIDVQDVNVYNILLDHTAIDHTALMTSVERALEFLRRYPNARKPLVFMPRGERIAAVGRGVMNTGGSSSAQPTFLADTTDADISRAQDEVRQTKCALELAQRDLADCKQHIETSFRQVKDADNRSSETNIEIDAKKADLADLKSSLSNLTAEVDEDTAKGIMDDITMVEQHMKGYVKDMQETKAKIDEEIVAEKAALEKQRAFEEQTSDARQALENARDDMEEIVTKVAKQGAVMNMVKEHRQKVMQKHQEIAKLCHDGEVAVQRVLDIAANQCERIDARSVAAVQTDIKVLEERKREEQERMEGTLADIERNYLEAQERFHEAKNAFEKVKYDHKILRRLKLSRMKDWSKFLKSLAKATQIDFLYNLSKKGHSGTIEFDHKHQTMHMQVKTAGSAAGKATSDSKSLSGGERSFTTLAFIMAVGESVRSPFRAMDEPDVFMDHVNRKVSLDLLIDLAHNYMNRQFIIITPLSVEGIQTSATTKIWVLKPPSREGLAGAGAV